MQSDFEKYLKNSHHFSDTINTHRRATADVMAGICQLLIESGAVTKQSLLDKLREMEQDSRASVSDATSRRLVCQLLRDRLG